MSFLLTFFTFIAVVMFLVGWISLAVQMAREKENTLLIIAVILISQPLAYIVPLYRWKSGKYRGPFYLMLGVPILAIFMFGAALLHM